MQIAWVMVEAVSALSQVKEDSAKFRAALKTKFLGLPQ
jgi:hypothetical protein